MSAVVPAPRTAADPAAVPPPPAPRDASRSAAVPPLGARPAAGGRYRVSLARDEDGVRAAQKLRHRVFAGELGAVLDGPEPGLDGDRFDAHCDHLLVRDETTGEVVGTYRLLPPERARAAGRLYSDGEFDLTAFAPLRTELVEVGRSCVHPDHRTGAVISLIWAGLARYMATTGHRYLTGCCSVPLGDGGALAASAWRTVRDKHLAPEEYRVSPLRPWHPGPDAEAASRAELPALLRGYLRLGAWVCGAPAHDPDFGVADLCVLLSMDRVNDRYLRHFLSLAPAS
ncbi:GNAT family N-acetyltransferase [Streptomyces sp. NBC_01497]|uniref:GNAT family N-acetyltransferase n=1 Tax=Streptomyces sp. NBC_01497 TaxID=2903885 RepID=UPI002E308014|nr:GNAT family N-acyltransferase [Streptomyces sp. NBC_01497]